MSGRLLITGASSGIGAACARAALDSGYQVVACGRSRPPAAGLQWSALDLEDTAGTEAWLTRTVAAGAQFAGVVLAAGFEDIEEAGRFDPELWRRTLRLNVEAPAQLCLGLAPLLAPGASVVMIGSTVAASGSGISPAYAASKAALEAMAWSLRLVLPDAGLRVNVIRAGPTQTPMFERLSAAAGTDAGPVNSPEEIARLAMFLVGPESAAIDATTITADHGRSAPGTR